MFEVNEHCLTCAGTGYHTNGSPCTKCDSFKARGASGTLSSTQEGGLGGMGYGSNYKAKFDVKYVKDRNIVPLYQEYLDYAQSNSFPVKNLLVMTPPDYSRTYFARAMQAAVITTIAEQIPPISTLGEVVNCLNTQRGEIYKKASVLLIKITADCNRPMSQVEALAIRRSRENKVTIFFYTGDLALFLKEIDVNNKLLRYIMGDGVSSTIKLKTYGGEK